jgi:subtilisin-like proprotein convertase family protein
MWVGGEDVSFLLPVAPGQTSLHFVVRTSVTAAVDESEDAPTLHDAFNTFNNKSGAVTPDQVVTITDPVTPPPPDITAPPPPPVLDTPADVAGIYSWTPERLMRESSAPDRTITFPVADRGLVDTMLVRVDISVTEHPEALELDLVSPSGTTVVLKQSSTTPATRPNVRGTFGIDLPCDDLASLHDQQIQGVWTLRMHDDLGRDSAYRVTSVALLPKLEAGTQAPATAHSFVGDAHLGWAPGLGTDVDMPIALTDAGPVGSVLVQVDVIAGKSASALEVTLTSPSGTKLVLHPAADDGGKNGTLHGTYGLDLASSDDLGKLAGEPLAGTWTLHVHDTADGGYGAVEAAALVTTTTPVPPAAPDAGDASAGIVDALGALGR